MLRTQIARCAVTALLSAVLMTPATAEAGAKKAKVLSAHSVFNAEKRKKTRHKIGQRLSYSIYSSVKFQGERNQRRDDRVNDRLEERALYIGFVGRADLGNGVLAFAHGEAEVKSKTTQNRSYGLRASWTTKEAFLSFKLNEDARITVGRMRFSDLNKWVADAAVDGVHYGHKSKNGISEIAAFVGVDDVTSHYLMFHHGRVNGKIRYGALTLLEKDGSEKRLHLSGYAKSSPTKRATYEASVGLVAGDAANSQPSGIGFDLRTTQKLGSYNLNPQLMLGFAAGSKGFRQPTIHSNKTYNAGQAQVHRYGYVFQPDLSNLAVGSFAVGIRPSRKLSVDLGLHTYAQLSKSTTGPIARVSGATTGESSFLGTEISLAGAWRPNKSSKVEFGIGHFNPGPALKDQSSATRVYLRLSASF